MCKVQADLDVSIALLPAIALRTFDGDRGWIGELSSTPLCRVISYGYCINCALRCAGLVRS